MLIDILANPLRFSILSETEQSHVIAEARYFNMLAQLKPILENSEQWLDVSPKIRQHIKAAYVVFTHQQTRLLYEKRHFQQLFSSLGIEWIYLKGAAYHLSQFPEFEGRLMEDIDILVAEGSLAKVEKALEAQGWLPTHLNNYDQQFYRNWSQEIPPMRHLHRRTELDLHFNILPKTLKESPDPILLLAQTLEIEPETHSGKVLTPEAMIIHSAIHLFYESDFSKGTRDLYDLYLLLKKFSEQPEFWQALIQLQTQIGNGNSVYYALRYCQLAFKLEIPKHIQDFYQQYKPSLIKRLLADFSFKRTLIYAFPRNHLLGHQFAVWILYIRGHLKRMPMRLLLPHLLRKSLLNLLVKEKNEDAWI